MKVLRIENNNGKTIAYVKTAKQAIAKIEKYASCSIAEGVTTHTINRSLNAYCFDIVKTCQDTNFKIELLDMTQKEYDWQLQGLNVQSVIDIFK